MARISLYQKSRDRSDFDKIVKKVKLLDKPIPYVMSQFNCTYPTALNFIKELQGNKLSGVSSEDSDFIATYFLKSVENKIDSSPSINSLIKFREDLSKFSIPTLNILFQSLTTGIGNTNIKIDLIRAVSYTLQLKYYNKVYKKVPPESLILKTQDLIRICL